MKSFSDVAVRRFKVTKIGPLPVPEGTDTAIVESVADRTVAGVPLKKTVFAGTKH
jgi:hypothetical protein